jgi:hypothetical protein
MKMVAITALAFCAGAMSALAAGINGKWVSEMQVGSAEGKKYVLTSTFNFKSDGNSFTGTIVQVSEASWMSGMNGKSFDISDGKVDGDKFLFKVTTETKQGQKTAVYEGTIEGDRLKGTTKYRGIGITQPFEAKRAD